MLWQGPHIPILDTQITTEELAYGAGAGMRVAAIALAVARLRAPGRLRPAAARRRPRRAAVGHDRALATRMLPALERDARGIVLVAARTRAARVSQPRDRRRPLGPLLGSSLERSLGGRRGDGGARIRRARRGRAAPERRAHGARMRRSPASGPVRSRLVDGRARRRRDRDFRYYDTLDDPWTAGGDRRLGGARSCSRRRSQGWCDAGAELRGRDPTATRAPDGRRSTASTCRSTPGELVLLVGESGSGKSTLLRAALGLVPHFHGGELRGRVRVAGLDTREHRPGELARHVGLVFQDPEAQLVMGTCPTARPPSASRTWAVAARRDPRPRAMAALAWSAPRHLAERPTRRSPAESASGWRSPRCSRWASRCCSSTSRRASSTRSAAEELIRTLVDLRQPRPRRHRRPGRAPHGAPVRRGRPRDRDGGRARSRSTPRRRSPRAALAGSAMAPAAGDAGVRRAGATSCR